MRTMNVGVVGCGAISDAYFKAGTTFEALNIMACADMIPERARDKAEKHKIAKAYSVKEMFADPEVEIVLNLTIPKAHAEIALGALEAGKHVYNEKPLAVTREEGRDIVKLAKKKKLLVGGAPDTFLGAGIQTCRKLIEDGVIGEPVAATAFMMCHGHESWHPDPAFYYHLGGGPLFDMGPYYLTALVNLLGPIRRVAGSARVTFPERTITSEPKKGTVVKVETPTHIAGTIDFENGAIGTLVTSFDVWAHHLPCIEVHGTEGSMSVPDPNAFGGVVSVKRHDEPEWREVELTHIYADQNRGIGVADMIYAIQCGRPHRASGELTFHVLDVMHAVLESSEKGRHVAIKSSCAQPAPLPTGLEEGKLDE